MKRIWLILSLLAIAAVLIVSSIKVQRFKSERNAAGEKVAQLQAEIGELKEEIEQHIQEKEVLFEIRGNYEKAKQDLVDLKERVALQLSQINALEEENSKLKAGLSRTEAQRQDDAQPTIQELLENPLPESLAVKAEEVV